LIDLYEADFHLPYLQTAVALTEKQIELFEDKTAGGFFSTAVGDPSLVMRIKEDYDGAEPAGQLDRGVQPGAPCPDDGPRRSPQIPRPLLKSFAARTTAVAR
jgi:hypothetical protein